MTAPRAQGMVSVEGIQGYANHHLFLSMGCPQAQAQAQAQAWAWLYFPASPSTAGIYYMDRLGGYMCSPQEAASLHHGVPTLDLD